ncbi:MAG: HAMP domain-containing protein [Spirochaetaceae bacterium]|nr:MAG: HAMP domain-containing protein [Spirochaetaceae bacterium]
MRWFRNSLRAQIFLSVFVSLAFIIVSMSYIFFTTLRLQQLVNNQFRSERFFQQLQRDVAGLQEPLLDYLSSRSSQALGRLLIDEQMLRSVIPNSPPMSNDPIELTSRQIFSMLNAYLDQVQQIISLKRARAVPEYTALYEQMQELNSHIVAQIDVVSLAGLRRQLENYEVVIAVSRRLQLWNLLVIVFAFFCSIFWMLYSISRVTDPMHRLAEMAGELAAGNFDIEDIRIRTVTEVSTVVSAFNNMKNDIRAYVQEIEKQKEIEQGYMEEKLRNMKMEQLLKRMELYTMQAQMNPHFLFNTLNTGVQLAITERAEKTADFMEHLALFFRHNVRERKLVVPLRHEIEGLESYLYVLRIRFPKSLSLSLSVDDNLLDTAQVPALILQPLVENSVIHAFRSVRHEGKVDVRVWKEDHRVSLSVTDNGCGMPAGLAKELLRPHPHDIEYNSRVMGLENVIQRLYFFYPDNPGVITIDSATDRGTAITISIDTREEPCIPS